MFYCVLNHHFSMDVQSLVLSILAITSFCRDCISRPYNDRQWIHHHMSKRELVDAFGVTACSDVPEYDVVYPTMQSAKTFDQSQTMNGEEQSYVVKVFGRNFELQLKRDEELFPESSMFHHLHPNNRSSIRAQRLNCLFSGHVTGDDTSLVSISLCDGHLNGLVSTKDVNFFIKPVPSRLAKTLRRVTMETDTRWPGDLHPLSYPHILYMVQGHGSSCGVMHHQEDRFVDRELTRFAAEVPKYIELMIVSDSTMFDYHGNELENYLKTVMSIAAGAFRSPSIQTNISLHVTRCLVLETHEADPVIAPDAQTSLRNFCEWQRLVYPEDVTDPQHFDLAALITRHDLSRKDILTGSTKHGVLGLANIASACVRARRCAIVEDNGLATGLTVAHEIGHALGMEHDGARNSCPASGSIMASVTSSGPGAYVWSQCSVDYLKQFLNSPLSHCLNDAPMMNKNLSLFRGWRPGQLFHRNEQCRFLYGDSPGACSHRTTECDKLWCLRHVREDLGRTGPVCSTNRAPPADGTECGEGQWCIGGECVQYGEEGPDPIHGGWSEWDPIFSECSRTCGGGIRRKRRHCNSPTPSFGGLNCKGRHQIIETCNQFDCVNSTQFQFAQEQCSSKNSIPYKGEITTWEPYTDTITTSGDAFCKLSCASYERRKVVRFGRFIDGTRCDVLSPLADDTAMCVDGVCKHFGCDFTNNSTLRLDTCAVCGGDNSSCEMMTGTETTRLQAGSQLVVEIPEGATYTNITLSCEEGSQMNLAVEIDDSTIFYGNEKKTESRVYAHGNDVISYVGLKPESIQIRGPTLANITVYATNLNLNEESHAVLYWVYYRAIRPRVEYEWRLSDTHCSKSCGFGLTQTEVICVEKGRSDLSPQPEVLCIHLRKPELIPRPCNEFDCPHRWETEEWGDCSVSCGGGTRVRHAYCARENTAGVVEILPREECAEEPLPTLKEHCTVPPCHDEEKTCNATLRAVKSEGSFTSPGYPDFYPMDVNCFFHIIVELGYWIEITFLEFDVEASVDCVFDYVEVLQEDVDGTRSSVARHCGSQRSEFSLVVSSHVGIVHLHSDGIITRRGFMANFQEVDP